MTKEIELAQMLYMSMPGTMSNLPPSREQIEKTPEWAFCLGIVDLMVIVATDARIANLPLLGYSGIRD